MIYPSPVLEAPAPGSTLTILSIVISVLSAARFLDSVNATTESLTYTAFATDRHCVRASGTTAAAANALLNNEFFIVLYLSNIFFLSLFIQAF